MALVGSDAAFSPEPAWVQVLLTAPAAKKQRIEIQFSPTYLQILWSREAVPHRPVTRRVPLSPDGDTMFLNAPLVLPGGTVFAQAWLVPAIAPDTYHIRVKIEPYMGAQNVRVTLHWDTDEYTVTLRGGQLTFEDISLPVISRGRKNIPQQLFTMTFEFEQNSKNVKC